MKDRGDYFKTDVAFWNWMRSQLRRVWSHHPSKLDFIKRVRFTKRIGKRPIYHVTCVMCKEDHPLKNIEINHKINCGDIKDSGYHLRLFDVGMDDMEALCKPCHQIVTYSERHDMSIEDARIEKQVVAFAKLPAKKQKEVLGDDAASNAEGRKGQYRELCRRAPITLSSV